jgi:hypothetical protein
MARESDLVATERALWRAHMECNTEHNQAAAVQQDYRARLHATTAGRWCSLDFDRVLSGCQFILSVQEVNLEQQEEKLAEELVRDLYPLVGRDLLAELEWLHSVAGVERERELLS